MTEAFFYHLQRLPLERVLPTLLEKSLERRWHAVVQVTGEERAAALDDGLWTYDDQSFLPHGRGRYGPIAAHDPVVIALDFTNPNECRDPLPRRWCTVAARS